MAIFMLYQDFAQHQQKIALIIMIKKMSGKILDS